jgi:adenylate kinase family enzyme
LGRCEQPKEAGVAPLTVVISGQPGAGKTTLARELAEALDAPRVSFGDVVRAAAADRYGDHPTAHQLERVGNELIRKGWPQFCSTLLEHVPRSSDVVIIDGVRHLQATETLHELTGRRPVWLYVETESDELNSRLARRDPRRLRRNNSAMEKAATKLVDHADFVVPSPWNLSIVTSAVRRLLASRTTVSPAD